MLAHLVLDDQGHHPGCPMHGKEPQTAYENSSHVDLFCDCHAFQEPLILSNGTDIAWPAGWTQAEAEAWREKNNLVHRSEAVSGP